jgi:beta-lactamase class A
MAARTAGSDLLAQPGAERMHAWGSKTGSIRGAVNDVGFVSGTGGASRRIVGL